MSPLLRELLDLLVLDPLDDDRFRGRHAELAIETRHVFGGLVAAQAVMAAYATVGPGRPMHSLHAYFLRPGDPDVPIDYVVRRTRDGRSFSHRRVDAVQHGREIMELSCSFAVPEPGLTHQTGMPDVAAPETLSSDWERLAGLPDTDVVVTRPGPFDVRTVGTHSRVARDLGEGTDRTRAWLRAEGAVPPGDGDVALQQALLVYASDLTVLDPTTRPLATSIVSADVVPTTVDHAVWFHAPTRVDDWWLYDVDSPWAGAGRGYARGRVFDRSGTLVAQVAQEGLIRLPRG